MCHRTLGVGLFHGSPSPQSISVPSGVRSKIARRGGGSSVTTRFGSPDLNGPSPHADSRVSTTANAGRSGTRCRSWIRSGSMLQPPTGRPRFDVSRRSGVLRHHRPLRDIAPHLVRGRLDRLAPRVQSLDRRVPCGSSYHEATSFNGAGARDRGPADRSAHATSPTGLPSRSEHFDYGATVRISQRLNDRPRARLTASTRDRAHAVSAVVLDFGTRASS